MHEDLIRMQLNTKKKKLHTEFFFATDTVTAAAAAAAFFQIFRCIAAQQCAVSAKKSPRYAFFRVL